MNLLTTLTILLHLKVTPPIHTLYLDKAEQIAEHKLVCTKMFCLKDTSVPLHRR